MATYTVRLKQELVRYVEMTIEADTMLEAASAIEDVVGLSGPDTVAPGEWDIEDDSFTVEMITTEDGTIYHSEAAFVDEALAAFDAANQD